MGYRYRNVSKRKYEKRYTDSCTDAIDYVANESMRTTVGGFNNFKADKYKT